ncbi:hypothetical protein BpHYR1_014235 [Brachionus plicatilis]|uniref:Uncharacterized protein n=1 Tax=Brachionus plicatilis TaxID=10195 RepID=A0A3M7SBT6_BRAPC|nr:hypothetical protein BpHYR1_014235 [Brachionus plicatilis]
MKNSWELNILSLEFAIDCIRDLHGSVPTVGYFRFNQDIKCVIVYQRADQTVFSALEYTIQDKY